LKTLCGVSKIPIGMYFEFPAKGFSLIHLVPELDSSKD
jgi:hypothetical protein